MNLSLYYRKSSSFLLSINKPCKGFPSGSVCEESACQCRRRGFDPWRRAWQPTPVFLPGESHRQRSLVGYSPWGGKESDTAGATEHAQKPVPQLLTVLLQPMNAQIAVSWVLRILNICSIFNIFHFVLTLDLQTLIQELTLNHNYCFGPLCVCKTTGDH